MGGGPAGWSLAAALRARGVDVTLIAPAPHAPWPAKYGAFADELESLDCPASFVWPDTVVKTDAATRRLGRRYARVDADALQAKLVAAAAGARVVEDTVELGEDPREVIGREIHRADLVVDARGAPRGDAAQVAYGVTVPLGGSIERGVATMMDFSAVEGVDGPPSFLYALPLGDRVFVEETSLVARPPLTIDVLRARLQRRLAGLGLELRDARDEERCLIWMDAPPPPRDAGVVPFGAAAGFVHPATGYSIVRTLTEAPRVAEAITSGAGAAAAIDAMWPPELRRARALHDLGREVLLDLDRPTLQRFFEAFFETPGWPDYLSGTAPGTAVAATMWALFGSLPWALKWRASRPFGTFRGWRALTGRR